MFFVYSVLYAIAVIVLLIPEYLRRPEEMRSRWLRQKFGYLPKASSTIWVHAVSVGEVNASLGLLRKLRSSYPDSPLVLSTVTDTGQKVASEKVPEGTRVVYLPFDMGFILQRSVGRIHPKMFIVVETELWPNLFRVLSRNRVPVALVNGRISEKSSGGYRKISFFMKRVFSFVQCFGMQADVDAERLIAIGAPKERVSVTGNFKFDMKIAEEVPSWAASLGGPVIVAGSTHKGEEEIILDAYKQNRRRFAGLKLLLVPRHPERFSEVEELLTLSGVSYVKRSELGQAPGAALRDKEIVLVDTMGELSALYGVADIVIIGKSFVGKGGQNPLEPAFWGKPVICGPHMENFPFIQEFFREGAAFQVEVNALAKKIKELLLLPENARKAGMKAKELFIRNSGAEDRAMEIISGCLR